MGEDQILRLSVEYAPVKRCGFGLAQDSFVLRFLMAESRRRIQFGMRLEMGETPVSRKRAFVPSRRAFGSRWDRQVVDVWIVICIGWRAHIFL